MEIVLEEEIVMTSRDLARANDREALDEKQTTVRLTFDGVGREGMAPFILVGPPRSFVSTLVLRHVA
jgi:hypothetical protein